MEDHIFEEKYEGSMEELKKKISEENYRKLELFFANTDLDYKQRSELIGIIEDIRVNKKTECEYCSEEGCCGCR